jgi:hypothetical protein
MPGSEEIVKAAATEGGWIAALFALIVVCAIGSLGFIVRQLWADHRELNIFVRDKLAGMLTANTVAISRFGKLMASRKCLAGDGAALDQIEADSGTENSVA